MKPKNLKAMQKRAAELPAWVDNKAVVVQSQSEATKWHQVVVAYSAKGIEARCDCKWAEHGGIGCVHVMAALQVLAARNGRRVSFWGSDEEAARQKRRTLALVGNGEALYVTTRPQ